MAHAASIYRFSDVRFGSEAEVKAKMRNVCLCHERTVPSSARNLEAQLELFSLWAFDSTDY